MFVNFSKPQLPHGPNSCLLYLLYRMIRSCSRHLWLPAWHPLPHFWTESQVSVGAHIVSSSREGSWAVETTESMALPWHLSLFRRGHSVQSTQSYKLEWVTSRVGREFLSFYLSFSCWVGTRKYRNIYCCRQPSWYQKAKQPWDRASAESQNRRTKAVSLGPDL